MTDYRTARPESQRLAHAFKGFIKKEGITQAQIAHELKRSIGWVSERASGLRPLDTDMLDVVASLAKVSLADLITILKLWDDDVEDAIARAVAEGVKRDDAAADSAAKAATKPPTSIRRGRRA